MITKKNFSGHQFSRKTGFFAGWLLLLTFTIRAHADTTSCTRDLQNDTIPQTEVFNLKRADVYVVIVGTDSVHIRLKNRDSIMMSRTNFDTLSAAVKKEISANNDGIFSSEQT